MILRRFTTALKQQNWTTILIEFVLLVGGVFLGIQAANWNEQRAEDAKAQAYLARIRVNLEADLLSIERREILWRQVIAYGKGAIRYAETGELVEGSAWKTWASTTCAQTPCFIPESSPPPRKTPWWPGTRN